MAGIIGRGRMIYTIHLDGRGWLQPGEQSILYARSAGRRE